MVALGPGVMPGNVQAVSLPVPMELAIAAGIHVAPGLVATFGTQSGIGVAQTRVRLEPGAGGQTMTRMVARAGMGNLGIIGLVASSTIGAPAAQVITIVMPRLLRSRCALRRPTMVCGGIGASALTGLGTAIAGRISWSRSVAQTILKMSATAASFRLQMMALAVAMLASTPRPTTRACQCAGPAPELSHGRGG